MSHGRNKRGAGRLAAWVAVCLFAGVVLNVAVAWGLVWLKPIPVGTTPNVAKVAVAPLVALALPKDLPKPDKFFGWTDFAESHWQMLWDEPGPDGKAVWPPNRSVVIHLTRSGWPTRSLQHQDMVEYAPKSRTARTIKPTNFTSLRPGVDIGSKRFGTFPVWPGFLINTLLFGAIVGLSLWGAEALRTRSRRREGVCVACGYDRRSLAAGALCPECGGLPEVAVDRPPGAVVPP